MAMIPAHGRFEMAKVDIPIAKEDTSMAREK